MPMEDLLSGLMFSDNFNYDEPSRYERERERELERDRNDDGDSYDDRPSRDDYGREPRRVRLGGSRFDDNLDGGDGGDRIDGGLPRPEGRRQSGRGSWYSQAPGWVDRQDRPNSNALGVRDSDQGIATPGRDDLGGWYDVTDPNGRSSYMQKTDVGPARWTGRNLDVSANGAANRLGYGSPNDFPTDGQFSFQPVSAPTSLAQGSPAGPVDYSRAEPDLAAPTSSRTQFAGDQDNRYAGGFGGPSMQPPRQRPFGPGQRPESSGGIGTLIGGMLGVSPEKGERFARSLAAGLAAMKGPGGLAAFGQGMGASMQGGQKYADENFKGDRAQSNADRTFDSVDADRRDRRDIAREGLDIRRQDSDSLRAYRESGGRSGGGTAGSTERMVKSLVDKGYSEEEAFGIVKRGGGSDADRIRSERLAFDAAKQDPAYQKDPQGTIEKYRKEYVKRPSAKYDVDASMKNAEAAIDKAVRTGNKVALDRILKKAEEAGLDKKQIQLMIERAKSGSTGALDAQPTDAGGSRSAEDPDIAKYR